MPYANPDDKRAQDRAYYVANKETIQARATAWNKANAERRREIARRSDEINRERRQQRYIATRERRLAQMSEREARLRAARDPRFLARGRERAARRRARLRGAFVEAIDPLIVWDRDKGICGICGEPADLAEWHMDHVVPVARGGAHSYANVQVAHPFCNRSKGAGVA